MTPTHIRLRSLSGTVLRLLLIFSLAITLSFGLLATGVLYQSYEKDAEQALVVQTEVVADALAGTSQDKKVEILEGQVSGSIRYTLIAADGTVLFDSAVSDQMDNHADRPEVKGAQESGEAVSSRYSATLKTDTVYAAVRTDDGMTIRLAQTRNSLWSFVVDVAVPLVALIVLVLVAAMLLSRVLTRRVIQPINALNLETPLDNEIYEEMDPLLERIDDQQTRLKVQNEELARAENMRREFSANVSHEMKTPLTVISGYAELMKNGVVMPEDTQQFASLIYDEAQVMRALIDDVLTISRLEETPMDAKGESRINLLTVAQNVVSRLESFAADKGVKVTVTGTPSYILGRDTLSEQMLYNLVENGIRYNHEGGNVTVDVQCDDAGRPCVKVSDTGAGIPVEYREKVFERFFRIDKSRSKETGGTGLGLAIVKHAVQFQGGTIEIQSEVGKGTTFTLIFPDEKTRAHFLETVD